MTTADGPPMPPAGSTVRVGMQFGPEWFELPVGGPDPGRPDDLESQVEARIQRDPEVAEHRQQLLDMLTGSAEQARRRRAVAAALRFDRHELDMVSMATLHVTAHRAPAATPEERIHALREQLVGEVGEVNADSASEVQELPAGATLRIQLIGQARDGDDQDAVPLAENVQYWLPVPDHPVNLLVLYSTPNVAGAEPFVAELDQIMDTFRMVL